MVAFIMHIAQIDLVNILVMRALLVLVGVYGCLLLLLLVLGEILATALTIPPFLTLIFFIHQVLNLGSQPCLNFSHLKHL